MSRPYAMLQRPSRRHQRRHAMLPLASADVSMRIPCFRRCVLSSPAPVPVAKDKSLMMIFDEDSGLLAWANPSLDVTPDVVALLDQNR
jgi:hypothetical protein